MDITAAILKSTDEGFLEKIKATLDHLDGLGIQYQITGSLGMKMLGVIDRCPRDLDLVVTTAQRDQVLLLPEDDKQDQNSVTKNDIAMGSTYWPKKVNGIHVCFFERVSANPVEREFMGKTYLVSNPDMSIEAKLVILKNRLNITNYNKDKAIRHADDIKKYFEWLSRTGEDNPFKVEIPALPTTPDTGAKKDSNDGLPW